MKNIILLLSLLITFNCFSQEITESSVHSVYLECLTDFLSDPIVLHKKDKKGILVMSENMKSPKKITNKKVIWIYGDIEVNEPLKGKKEKHNGRSVVTLSHKSTENGLIEVQIHQWFLTNLESETYMINPIPDSNKEYAKKNNQYYFEMKNNQWIFKNKN